MYLLMKWVSQIIALQVGLYNGGPDVIADNTLPPPPPLSDKKIQNSRETSYLVETYLWKALMNLPVEK